MAKRRGKRYTEALQKIETALEEHGNGGLTPEAACALAKETAVAKFDMTIEAHIRLGVDPRHADQMVRGSVVLPRGTGKDVRVLVFAGGEKLGEARESGAEWVGGDDLVKRIQEGWTDFDVAIATPDMMSKVAPLGRILGPRGLMPNPKAGTVTFDIGRAVKEAKAGRVEFRTDRYGIVHSPIGKASFESDALHENLSALVEALLKNKPSTAKGQYLRTIFLAGSQGPSVPIDVREAAKLSTA